MTEPTIPPADAPPDGLYGSVSLPKPARGPFPVPSPPEASDARVALPDAPGWYASPSVAHWLAPDRCPHPDDRVFGPCDCRA